MFRIHLKYFVQIKNGLCIFHDKYYLDKDYLQNKENEYVIADYKVHKLHVLARLKHKVNHAISNNQPLFCIGFQLADFSLSDLNISKRFTKPAKVKMKVLMNSCLVLLIVIAYLISPYVGNISVVAQNIDSSFGVTTPMHVSTNGTVTSTRVIDVSTDHPKTEVSFTEDAIINNVGNVSNTGTYIATIESSNTTKGIGQGIITSDESNNMVAWNVYDLGKRIDNTTTFVFNGIIFFDVLPPHDGSNEFMFLDDRVGLYRSEVNDTGSIRDMDMGLVWSL